MLKEGWDHMLAIPWGQEVTRQEEAEFYERLVVEEVAEQQAL